MLFSIALVFGWRIGGLAGGVGSALADVLGGYFLWAPWTLIIKGVEGVLVGWIAALLSRNVNRSGRIASVVAVIVGSAWMITGYYIAGSLIFGAVPAATEIPGNLIQAGVAVGVALPLAAVLKKALGKSNYETHTHR